MNLWLRWGVFLPLAAAALLLRFWWRDGGPARLRARYRRDPGGPRLQANLGRPRTQAYAWNGYTAAALVLGVLGLGLLFVGSDGVFITGFGMLVAASIVLLHAQQTTASWARTLVVVVGCVGGATCSFLGLLSLAGQPILPFTAVEAWVLTVVGVAGLLLGGEVYSAVTEGLRLLLTVTVFGFFAAMLGLYPLIALRASADRSAGWAGVVVAHGIVPEFEHPRHHYLILRRPAGGTETRYGVGADFEGVSPGDSVTQLPGELRVRIVRAR